MSGTQPAASLAYEAVKKLILDGEIAGGDLISENALAGQLGMSRTPMRSAFQRLESEGWLTLYPKRGAVVTPVTSTEKREVLEARVAIEAHAVASMPGEARRTLHTELVDIAKSQSESIAARSLTDFSELDVRFHRAIVAAAGNSVILGFYDSLRERQRRMVESSVHASAHSTEAIGHEHLDLAEAVARGEAERFTSMLRSHLERVHEVRLSNDDEGAK